MTMIDFVTLAINAYLDESGCSCDMPYYQCPACAFKEESADLAEFIIKYKVDKEK